MPTQLAIGLQRRGRYEEIGSAIGTVVQYGMSHGAEFTGGPIAPMHDIGKDAVVAFRRLRIHPFDLPATAENRAVLLMTLTRGNTLRFLIALLHT